MCIRAVCTLKQIQGVKLSGSEVLIAFGADFLSNTINCVTTLSPGIVVDNKVRAT